MFQIRCKKIIVIVVNGEKIQLFSLRGVPRKACVKNGQKRGCPYFDNAINNSKATDSCNLKKIVAESPIIHLAECEKSYFSVQKCNFPISICHDTLPRKARAKNGGKTEVSLFLLRVLYVYI